MEENNCSSNLLMGWLKKTLYGFEKVFQLAAKRLLSSPASKCILFKFKIHLTYELCKFNFNSSIFTI